MTASRSSGPTWLGLGPLLTLTVSLTSELQVLLQETSPPLWRILGLILLLTEPAPLPTLEATHQAPIPQSVPG